MVDRSESRFSIPGFRFPVFRSLLFFSSRISPLKLPAVAAVALFTLVGCGSHDEFLPAPATPTPTPTAGPTLGGQLIGGSGPYPGAIKGVRFRTASQSGFTDDNGTFNYVAGESVTFGIADVDFKPVNGAALLSPWQLAGAAACTPGDELTRLLVLLYSLDSDADPTTGTTIAATPAAATGRVFATLSDADVSALVDQLIPGRSTIDGASAVDLFITQMDGELWQQVGVDDFPLTVGLVRSQGVATDGSSWFFSWKLGLEKTDLDYAIQVSNTFAIPLELSALGDDHIGDIDYWNGKLYAPIEDGGTFQHPHIVIYDPGNLAAGQIFPLLDTPLTKGVPWVAVDGPRGRLYVAEWDPTPQIFVLDLETVTYTGPIPLHTTVGRIQGGKVFEGSLYLSSDNATKDIYKVNLDTGTVIRLFALNQNFEEEGLVFLAQPDGSLLHTLNVTNPPRGTELRHHRRTRAPLRQSVCR